MAIRPPPLRRRRSSADKPSARRGAPGGRFGPPPPPLCPRPALSYCPIHQAGGGAVGAGGGFVHSAVANAFVRAGLYPEMSAARGGPLETRIHYQPPTPERGARALSTRQSRPGDGFAVVEGAAAQLMRRNGSVKEQINLASSVYASACARRQNLRHRPLLERRVRWRIPRVYRAVEY